MADFSLTRGGPFYALMVRIGLADGDGLRLRSILVLNAGDPSALADFGAMYGTVQAMQPLPIGFRQLLGIAALLLTPFAPLALTEMSVRQLLGRRRRKSKHPRDLG